MRQVPKTELSPDNGCVVDTKWKLGPLSYHACAAGPTHTQPEMRNVPLPELIVYDHTGFRGAYARTNLSFHYLGEFWNDRISSLIVVNGVWRFYRDEYYKGDHWDLGPGYYESRIDKHRRARDLATQLQALTGQQIVIRDGKAIITDAAA